VGVQQPVASIGIESSGAIHKPPARDWIAGPAGDASPSPAARSTGTAVPSPPSRARGAFARSGIPSSGQRPLLEAVSFGGAVNGTRLGRVPPGSIGGALMVSHNSAAISGSMMRPKH
jgi:hypothetical protein